MKKNNFAYETYRNVEAETNYKTAEDRKRYEASLLTRTQQVEMPFLRKQFPRGVGRVLEVGSGSGRILHTLLLEKRAQGAVGIEISPSRVAFGKKWAQELGLTQVSHLVGDILSMRMERSFDTVLCVTSIFPFFDMLEKNGLVKALRTMRKTLKPGGILMLESETFVQEVSLARAAGGVARVWEEYRSGDPFRFNLIEYAWDEKKRTLVAHSQNVMRDRLFVDGPTTKKWHLERAHDIKKKILAAGFKQVRFFGGFDSSRYTEGKSRRIVIVARG